MTEIKNDRSYIKKLLLIAVPMMVQNGISNFVNLLDNLMIGRVGTNALSGVAIANQLPEQVFSRPSTRATAITKVSVTHSVSRSYSMR